jgi:hypothetical protein
LQFGLGGRGFFLGFFLNLRFQRFSPFILS